MTTWKRYAVLAAAGILLASTAQAQVRQGTHAHPYGYAPTREVTIHGAVDKVVLVGRGFEEGVHLVVKADNGVAYDVRLGPSWYLAEKQFVFTAGENVKITGRALAGATQPVLIARKVTCPDGTLVLRNARGERLWMWPYWRPYYEEIEIG